MASVTEIAPDVFRITTFNPTTRLSYSHFVIRDDEPVLYHAGLRSCFAELSEAAASVVDVQKIRHIGFSHFESDECGALNDWLEAAPDAVAFTGPLCAATSLNDFAIRSPAVLAKDATLETGTKRFRLIPTPHLPHGWDSAMLFEESDRTLFVSDLFTDSGDPAPIIDSGLADRAHQILLRAEQSLFAHSTNFNPSSRGQLEALAELGPKTLAVMHGSSFSGEGSQELLQLASAMEDVFKKQAVIDG